MTQQIQVLEVAGMVETPLFRALESGDLEQAERLLSESTRLTWRETALYAPLAFCRPPWLLRRILDLGPRETVFCAGKFVRLDGGWHIKVCGTLLTVAAALDDLPSVEELLRRGYVTAERPLLRCYRGFERWSGEMMTWHAEMMGASYVLGVLWTGPGSPPQEYKTHDKVWRYQPLGDITPLSAAIWCGAARCVERLLPEPPEQLPLLARNALSWGPLSGDAPRRQAVADVVVRKYGLELEQLLAPGDFPNRDSPLFLPCVARHPEWFSLELTHKFINWAGESKDEDDWAWNTLPLIPPHLLEQAVQERLSSFWWDRSQKHPLLRVCRHPQVHISIDRCAVPKETGQSAVLAILAYMDVTGQPPENGLSGLAAAVLNAMTDCLHGRSDLDAQCRTRLVQGGQADRVLEAEDPEMIRAYLSWKVEREEARPADADLLMSVLEIGKECHYEL